MSAHGLATFALAPVCAINILAIGINFHSIERIVNAQHGQNSFVTLWLTINAKSLR